MRKTKPRGYTGPRQYPYTQHQRKCKKEVNLNDVLESIN